MAKTILWKIKSREEHSMTFNIDSYQSCTHTTHTHTHIHTHFQALLIFFGIFNQGLYITTTSAVLIFTAK